ncbi:hypothetical protein HN018_25360 (plasmid) [Lichenicola cladoniae]|uniref:Uncharacterized protein n=1 Tax=Lichenicola cladoniae TaxID=1484109 RepID=A0A6M8HZ11_9PROT|nr:hypothetical protein [Lichenicola cladoniae]NPD66808.1 hypothetical protein [Acetobacteraceae bacterium]QKE93496.1 hypothetical protein HN018_25360 [Lichenicola cladoniae]
MLLLLAGLLVGGITLPHQDSRSVEFQPVEVRRRFPLSDVGSAVVQRVPGLKHQGFISAQRRLLVARMHACDKLAGPDQVFFINEHFSDTTHKFRANVNSVGVCAAISERDAGQKPRPVLLLPVVTTPSGNIAIRLPR